MSTIKINELATSGISLTDFFVKANENGLATKNTIQGLSTFFETVGEVGFKGQLLIADTPTSDGWYFAGESGTYTNAGNLVVDISNNIVIVIVSDTQTVFTKLEIPISLTLDATPTAGSTKLVESGGVKTYIDRNVLNKQYAENVITDDTFEDTTNWQKVSGAGTLTFPTLNNKKVLYANDCIVDFVIPVSEIDTTKTWAFGIFVENSVLASGLRILAQGSTGVSSGVVGDRYDYTIPIGDSAKKLTLLSDGYTIDPSANFLRIYIDATGSEIWLSNPFLGNAPKGMFKPVDTVKSLAEKGITDASIAQAKAEAVELTVNDYVNLIPDNIFQTDISYFDNQPNIAKFNVTLEKFEFENDYSKFSLKATANHATSSNNFIGIYQDITSIIREGDTLRFKGLIFPTVSGVYLERRFRDSSDATIQNLTDINLVANEWNYIDFEVIVPVDAVYANFFVRNIPQNDVVYLTAWDLHKKNTISKHKINNPTTSTTTSSFNIVEVDAVNGNDANSGILGNPVATISKGIELVGSALNPKIILRQGDYREILNFNSFSANCKNIEITTPVGERSRILGSIQLTSFTKTSGYTNVYEASCNRTIPTHGTHLNKRIVFEDGNPSKPILEAERHPLQKGLSHRLPYTELIEIDFDTDLATTLTNLDSEINGGVYYDTANNKMYVVASDQSNPSTNGFNYEFTSLVSTTSPDLNKYLSIKMNNVAFYYSRGYGCDMSNFVSVERNNCSVFGAKDNGFQDDTNILKSYNEESAGCGNDGQNGHFYNLSDWGLTDERTGMNQATYFNSWCHDNYDDGMSFHERGYMVSFGGLYEYNWDRGVAPATTCSTESHNPYIRKNGLGVGVDVGAVGIGYSVVGSLIAGTTRNGISAIVYGGVIENNIIGAGVESDVDNKLLLENTTLRENITANLSADFGKIEANNCKSTQSSGLHKITSNGGVINVINNANLS